MTKKEEKAGRKGILEATGTLGQTLKVFDGIYGTVLPNTGDLTVEQWMLQHGVKRFESVSKTTGKVTKKGYTPTLVLNAWDESMKKTTEKGTVVYTYKDVNAYVECGSEFGDPDAEVLPVFTKEEALKDKGRKAVKVHKLVAVDGTKWSVAKILDGLMQSVHIDEERIAAETSLATLERLKEEGLYAIKMTKDSVTGHFIKELIPVKPEDVKF